MRMAFLIGGGWGVISVLLGLAGRRLLHTIQKHYAVAPAAEVAPSRESAKAISPATVALVGFASAQDVPAGWKVTSLPFWQGARRKGEGRGGARTKPFQSTRLRRAGRLYQRIEEFETREARKAFFADLKAMGTPGLAKTTDQRDGKIVWQVARCGS